MSLSQRELLSETITGAVTGKLGGVAGALYGMSHLAVEVNFTYGSGGTNVKLYVQTSVDGGVNWIDIAAFLFTTTSARKVVSLNSKNSVTTLYTPTDAALTDDTVKDGILGDRLRTKLTTTGTYAGVTTLKVNVVPKAA